MDSLNNIFKKLNNICPFIEYLDNIDVVEREEKSQNHFL